MRFSSLSVHSRGPELSRTLGWAIKSSGGTSAAPAAWLQNRSMCAPSVSRSERSQRTSPDRRAMWASSCSSVNTRPAGASRLLTAIAGSGWSLSEKPRASWKSTPGKPKTRTPACSILKRQNPKAECGVDSSACSSIDTRSAALRCEPTSSGSSSTLAVTENASPGRLDRSQSSRATDLRSCVERIANRSAGDISPASAACRKSRTACRSAGG